VTIRRAPCSPFWVAVLACAGCATSPPTGAAPPRIADFVGSHRGTLHVHGPRGAQQVPMGLDVETIADVPDRLRWVLRYGEGDRAQVRDYRLCVDDAATGRCRIDEQNGIELAARFVGGELVSVFAVQGQTLCCRYRLVPGGVEFALESWSGDAGSPTGNGVTSFGTVTVQRAALVRTGR
jgi:hypothetical protein